MSLLTFLLGNAGKTGARTRPAPVKTIATGRTAVLIPRHTTLLFEERGWRWSGDALVGHFRTPFGSFEGCIKGARGGKPEYYIIGPPQALLDGSHGLCFRQRGCRTFYIHWNTRPRDVNAGILHVERYLMEALS